MEGADGADAGMVTSTEGRRLRLNYFIIANEALFFSALANPEVLGTTSKRTRARAYRKNMTQTKTTPRKLSTHLGDLVINELGGRFLSTAREAPNLKITDRGG